MPYHIDEENSELAFEVREGNKLVIKIKSNIFSDSLELYLIKVGDNTEPTDKNVFSSLRVLKEIENLHDTILKEINSVTSGFWELKQDSQGNEYISTKYNVLTEGGLTTYGLGEQKLGTIYDGLPIDNDTIYWEEVEGSRVLKAKGSGGGSTGLDETKLWNVLGTPGDQQIDYSHLRSAFSQFSNEFVTINTEQEITALKHFTAGLSIGSAKKKIYEKDGVLYIDSNVAITGALTMYATDGQSVSSIYDGLPIDNDTIYWETVEGSRVLKAKGSGGEAGSVQWGNISGKPTWIGDAKPTYNWYEIQGEKPFYTKEEIAEKYVTIDTEQEISGLKHFTPGLSVGESKKKIYEENGVVYIDADVAVTGAMTFYATAGRTVSTIMDAIAVDGITIKKENNVLKAIAGAGTSFDENAMWSALSGSSDNQINKSHLTTALDGYATQNWVIENYATKSELSAVSNKLNDFLEGSDADTIINKWKELEAFLSGMAETDNLAEILETKADKKYVDSTFVTLATKQTITGEKTFSSVLNTAAIKASGAITAPSMAASDWVTIAGIKLRKLEDGALMLEGNLALTGALTMYASNGQSFDTIYDGLPIDNDTIYWQEVDGSRVLKAREGSGSSFDKSAMWTALAGSTTEQINKSHLTTALTGYATESWVSGKNYAVKATTLAGYGITDGINAVSVTGTGNAVTAASISGHTLTLTKGSTFSLSGHKHAWSDITSGKPTTLSGYGITDAYTKTDADSRYVNVSGDTMTGNLSVKFSGRTDQINLFHSTTTNKGGISLTDTDKVVHAFHLTTTNLIWKGRTVWDSGNDGSGSGLDADLLDGTHKSGLLTALTSSSGTNISITVGGTTKSIADLYANSAAKLETARTIWGQSFDGTKPVTGALTSVTDITGTGTFTGANLKATDSVYVNGIRLHKTSDGVITLEGNLAVTGGITTYAIDPVSASTIMDGVEVDGTTIKKENGKLVAVGGGEAGSVAWGNITGKPSVFATNIANITDLHSSWDAVLKSQKPNWLTAVSIATISDLHANWDALLKATPSAYVTRWPTISEVTGKQNLIVKLNGGTTEGTNQFTYNATGAKTINITPAGIGSYTKSESDSKYPTKTGSGASGTWGIGITGNAATASKWATARTITLGSYLSGSVSLDGSTNVTLNANVVGLTSQGNKTAATGNTSPASGVRLYQVYNNGYPTPYGNLLSVKGGGAGELLLSWANANRIYYRSLRDNGDNWLGWNELAFITDNVASATKLNTARTLWGKDFNGTQNISGEISTCTRIRNSKDNSLYLGNSDNTGWVYTQDIASHNGVENWAIGITGTAWFQKVNIGYAHSANGNYLLNVNGVISCSAYTGNYIRIECDDNGSNLQLKSAEINNFRSPLYLQYSSSFNLICCKGGGKVGIGTDAPNGKLHVEGNIYTSAIVSAYGYAGNHIRMECDNHGENIASRIDEINNYSAPLCLQHDTSNNLICCNGGGKVGIGTTSPTHKLTVEGNTKVLNIETHYGIGTDETGISSSAYYDISTPTIPAYKYRYVLGWQDNTTEGYTTGYGIGVYRSASKWGSMILEVLNYENKTRKAQLEIRGHDNVLWFSGDILAEGGGTFYGSDIRYKTIVQHVQLLSLNKIAEAPSFLYRWNRPNMNQNRLNLGGSAQYTQLLLPWAVEDNGNFLMMDYATVAYTFAVHTARHLLTYESRTDKKIKKLENRVKYLEKQLKKLGYEEVRTLDDSGI